MVGKDNPLVDVYLWIDSYIPEDSFGNQHKSAQATACQSLCIYGGKGSKGHFRTATRVAYSWVAWSDDRQARRNIDSCLKKRNVVLLDMDPSFNFHGMLIHRWRFLHLR
jgi:hypothetical protein